jgi:predicted GNAT superfamily acetyltransferase
LSYVEQFLAVEIPTDIQQLKKRDPELARRWRNSTRLVFRHYLYQGYRVVGFATSSGKEASAARGFYCLEKAEGDC